MAVMNTLHTCMKLSKNKNCKKKNKPKTVSPLKIIILLQYHASQKQFLVSTRALVYTELSFTGCSGVVIPCVSVCEHLWGWGVKPRPLWVLRKASLPELQTPECCFTPHRDPATTWHCKFFSFFKDLLIFLKNMLKFNIWPLWWM